VTEQRDSQWPSTVLGGLRSGHRASGAVGKIWSVIGQAYAVAGALLHVAFGVWYCFGFWIAPWWFVVLTLVGWAAIWVPIVRLWRRSPGMVGLAVFGMDMAMFLAVGSILDAAGWI
jgi:hypothetical protein